MSLLTFALQTAGLNSPSFEPPVPSQQCQVSDGGVDIVILVSDSAGNPVNLRLATGLAILVARPSGLRQSVPAAYYTNGLDGQLFFATGPRTPFGAGLSETGVWSVQAKFTLSGNLQYTSIGCFTVNPNLGA
jgi:hypothetical protein